MPRLYQKQVAAIKDLYFHKIMLVSDIAKKLKLPYSTVYSYTRVIDRGFKSRKDHLDFLARKRGYESDADYRKHLILTSYESVTDYHNQHAISRGFSSCTDYKNYLARKNNFKNLSAYQEMLAKRAGFKSRHSYNEFLAIRRGFKSYKEYSDFHDKQKQQKQPYRELSDVIRTKLKELNKPQEWLASTLSVSKAAIYKYISARAIPRKGKRETLYQVLNIDGGNLESLIQQLA